MTEKQFRRLCIALLVFAAILAYANTFTNDFVWDDASSILLHQHVQDPTKIHRLFMEDQHAFGRGAGNFYRPLVSVSFMVDYLLSRPSQTEGAARVLSPFLFHLSNTLWHALVAVLLFALTTSLGAPKFVRLLAPLIYVVHPLHTEAVAYISGRADPMSAAFIMLGLWVALTPAVQQPALWTGVAFAAALLSKESAVVFPFILLLATLLYRRPEPTDEHAPRAQLASLAVCGVLVGVYAALRFTVLRFGGPGETTGAPFLTRLGEAGQAYVLYLKLLFVPTDLHMERTMESVSPAMAVFGWLLVLLFAATAGFAAITGRRRIALGLGIFLITWFPISGVFPLNAPMAEHWMYLPMLGLVWALLELVWLVVGSNPLRYPAYAAMYTAAVVLLSLTVARNHDWRTNQSIYTATLEENPDSIRVNFNLGVTYEDLAANYSGARRHYQRVLQLYQDRKAALGDPDTYFEDELESHLSLARLYTREQMLEQAANHYEVLRRIYVNPSNESIIREAYINYAALLAGTGQRESASRLLAEGADKIPSLKEEMEKVKSQGPAPEGTATAAPTAPDTAAAPAASAG